MQIESRTGAHPHVHAFTRRLAAGGSVVAAGGGLGLAACGAPGASAPAANVPPVTLNFLIKNRSSPAAEDVLRKLFADQNQQNPKTQVNIELVASDAVLPQLTTRAASGQ